MSTPKRRPCRPPAPRAASVRAVPAVTRAVAILRLLGKGEPALGVNAIARALGLVPSTCLHILRVLAAEGLVAFDERSKLYRLDSGILALARGVLRHKNFSQLAQPHLDRLSRENGVNAIGVEVQGLEHIVVVAISHAGSGLRLYVDVGSRFPALISATGRCVAAFGGFQWSQVESHFQRLRWHRPPGLARWRQEIAQALREGYSVDEGNYLAGVTVIAVPVRDGAGRMTHSIVVVGLAEQVRQAGIARLAAGLREAADAISRRMASASG